MLARASSDAGTRLRRSKSTSTVHRHAPPIVESLDPDVAQQHAIAAATAAYARSQAQESIERKANRTIELGRSKSTASRKSLTSQGSHFPPRQLSVRSVPPQKSTQTMSTHRLSATSAPHPEKFPSFDPAPSCDRPRSLTRPLTAQPSFNLNEYGRPTSQPKSHRQGKASSITSQQIRKARSMYYASSVQTGSPIARLPAKYLTTPPPISTSPALSTAPATYVPTRSTGPSPLAVSRLPVAIALDETVDDARDKHLQEFQQRSIKHKPSLFLAPFKKRQDKSRDKTKRLSLMVTSEPSTNHRFTDDAPVDITVGDFMPPPNTKDKRSFSGSLKKKIKRMFRRTSNESPSLPVQQIDASREYFTHTAVLAADKHGDVPSPEEELLLKVQSRTPPSTGDGLRPIRPASRSSSKSSGHSNRSLHSEANVSHTSASRVTSWGTSASGETLTQRAIKRLTVIHEAKDSVGSITDRSASTSNRRKSLPSSALSAFKDPMHMESLAEEASTPFVDPKRVFSALMREIDASNSAEASIGQPDRTPGAESDVFESSTTKESHSTAHELHSRASRDLGPYANSAQKLSTSRPRSVATRSVQSKKSSIKSLGHAIRSTIRTVTPGEHRSSPFADEPVSAKADSNTPSSGAPCKSHSDQEGHTAIFKKTRISKISAIIPQDASVETSTPAPEQIEMRVAKAKNRWQTPLSESVTPHFPRQTDRLYTVVNLAQQQSLEYAVTPCEAPASPPSPTMQLSKSMQMPMSPSVYSRNTDGASILPNDSVMSFNGSHDHESAHQGGSAVILTSQSVRSYAIGTPSPNRPSSTHSSRDWKAWLSHEVSGIEKSSQEDLVIHGQYARSSQRLKRDLTQTIRTSHTGSEDTTVIVRESFETSTPRAQIEKSNVANAEVQTSESVISKDRLSQPATTSKGIHVRPVTLGELSSCQTRYLDTLASEQQFLVPSMSTPHVCRDHSTSTPSTSSSAPRPPLGTPNSARMNDRFPFLDTGGRSSSNNSSRSRQSKSPTSSVGSSMRSPKATPAPRAIYSDMPASPSGSTIAGVLNNALRRSEILQNTKENMTPPMAGGEKRPNISPLGQTSRPRSLQPLSSAILNRSSTNMADDPADATDMGRSKRASSPAETVVARPSLRVTVRPLSLEKLSRRPRSAFDLRSSPSPQPASELCRPTLRPKSSSRLLVHSPDSRPGAEASIQAVHVGQHDGSVTPGQRMAERFLRERKSTTVLERGLRKNASKFVREDTPAFL